MPVQQLALPAAWSVVRRSPADPLCICGHGRSVHGEEGSGKRACLACRDACATGSPCPSGGVCCSHFLEAGRIG